MIGGDLVGSPRNIGTFVCLGILFRAGDAGRDVGIVLWVYVLEYHSIKPIRFELERILRGLSIPSIVPIGCCSFCLLAIQLGVRTFEC